MKHRGSAAAWGESLPKVVGSIPTMQVGVADAGNTDRKSVLRVRSLPAVLVVSPNGEIPSATPFISLIPRICCINATVGDTTRCPFISTTMCRFQRKTTAHCGIPSGSSRSASHSSFACFQAKMSRVRSDPFAIAPMRGHHGDRAFGNSRSRRILRVYGVGG